MRVTGAAAATREGDARPAVAPGSGAPPAAAHSSALAQATPEMPQVQSGRADGCMAVALAGSAYEAAPARPPAERARDVGGAAAERSHCRAAADDGPGTPGSAARGAGSGQPGSVTQSAATAGVGPHAGGPGTPAVCSAAKPQSADGPEGMVGTGGGLVLQSLLIERGGRFLCAVALAEERQPAERSTTAYAGTQVAWHRAAAMHCPCSRSGTTEQ